VEQEYALTAEYDIARIFGEDFALQLAVLEPGGWTGPIYSGYGAHLVRVTAKQAGRSPDLSEIRDEVEQDYQYQRRQELNDIAYGRLRENYEVVIEDRPAPGSAMAGAGATPDPSTP
jgi:parvulin-like peptidyl-prolyl isomerase